MQTIAEKQARVFDLILVSSGGGKTTACKSLGARGIPVYDTDDCMPDGVIKNFLEVMRKHELWDYHNPTWHSLVIGGAYSRARMYEYLRNPVMLRIFDHTGWFATRSGILDSIRSVMLVEPDSIDARVARIDERNKAKPGDKAKEDWRKSKDWYRILRGQDEAREGAFAKLKEIVPEAKFRRVTTSWFWSLKTRPIDILSAGEAAQLHHYAEVSGFVQFFDEAVDSLPEIKRENKRVKFA
uniref:Uncharacterized protein n=1 Tax=viral metagenome TaxID=1070528 RepID=A0A2V0R947_9ZZZZ